MTIAGLGQIAIALMVAAIIVGFSAVILADFQTNFDDLSASNVNETLTWAGNNTA